MENEKVILVRNRPSDYYVNYNNGIKNIGYKWNGYVAGRKPHSLAIPREVFDHLNMSGDTIRSGELVVADEQPNKEEVLNEIIDVEEVLANSHTRDEIVAILTGNVNKMKSELKKITVKAEKVFVKNIADEIEGELTGNKIDFVDKWFSNELEDTK